MPAYRAYNGYAPVDQVLPQVLHLTDPRPHVVILGAVVLMIALLPVYPFGSTDIFDYIMHGRMLGLYHANPFVEIARHFRFDLYFQYVGWPDATSAYGPLWELAAGKLAKTVAGFAGDHVVQNVIAFKLLEMLFLLGSAGLLAAILHRAAPQRALSGFMLLAWNPVVLWETIGNGHNDIVMVFFVLAAVLAILYRRYTLGVLALVIGTLVKFIPALMIPAAFLLALRDLRSWRTRATFILVTASLALLLIVLSYAPFWDGPSVLSIQRRTKLFTTSLPTVVLLILQPKVGVEKATHTVSMAAAALTGLFALFEGARAWRDRSWMSFTRSAFDISIFYLLFTALWLWPWYAIWPLALGILLPESRALLGQVAASALMITPWIWGWMLLDHPTATPRWDQLRLAPIVLAVPWMYTLYLLANRARSNGRLQALRVRGGDD